MRCLANVSLSSFDSLDFRKLRMFLFDDLRLEVLPQDALVPLQEPEVPEQLGVVVVLQGAGEDAEVARLPKVAELLEEDGAVSVLDEVVDDRLDVGLLQEDLRARREGWC